MLGEMLIDACYAQQSGLPGRAGGQASSLIEERRKELKTFLETKSNFNASKLLEKLRERGSFLDDEEILLLMKDGKQEEALEKYIVMQKFDEAEEFCTNNQDADQLLTQLLKIYFAKYNEAVQCDALSDANTFRIKALDLMRKHSSDDELDPEAVIDMIPDDWLLQTKDYDMVNFLKSVFDHQSTVEENQKIAERLATVERLNTAAELNSLKQAYLVITDDMMCKVCKNKLGHKKIRIFPHGQAFHKGCATNFKECPITKQRFDNDPINQAIIETIKF